VSDSWSVEQLAAENAELRAGVAELRAERVKVGELMAVIATLRERIAELERVPADSSKFLSSAVVGCPVGEEAGEEALLAHPVWPQTRQAAGGVGILVQPHR